MEWQPDITQCQKDPGTTAEATLDQFIFGVRRNDFTEKYLALAATDDSQVKKKGRRELRLHELPAEKQKLFTGDEGSDKKEWSA